MTCPLSRRKAPWEHLKKAGETANAKALSGNELRALEEHKESQGGWCTRTQPTLRKGA